MDICALILTNVKYHHVMKMQPVKIPLVVLNVNVMMVLTAMEKYVLTLMSVRLILITVNQDLDARTTSADLHAKI